MKIWNNNASRLNSILTFGANYYNSREIIFQYAQRVKAIEGFDDFLIHGTPDYVFVNGNEDDEFRFDAPNFAEIIRTSSKYTGRNIRLISCQVGAKKDGFAQQLADILGVTVLAPTEIVNMDGDGNMFVSDNDVLADLWYSASIEERKHIQETGKWIEFISRKK